MKRFKIWSMMMLVVMMLPFVAACSSNEDGVQYEDRIDVSPAIGTWLCIKSTDSSGGKTYENLFVGQKVSIYSNDLYTSTSSSLGSIGSYKVTGQEITVSTNNDRTFIITAVKFLENRMTLEGSGEGISFKYVFEKVDMP